MYSDARRQSREKWRDAVEKLSWIYSFHSMGVVGWVADVPQTDRVPATTKNCLPVLQAACTYLLPWLHKTTKAGHTNCPHGLKWRALLGPPEFLQVHRRPGLNPELVAKVKLPTIAHPARQDPRKVVY